MTKSDRDISTQLDSSRSTSNTRQVETAATRKSLSQAVESDIATNEVNSNPNATAGTISPTANGTVASERVAEDTEEGHEETPIEASVTSNEKEKSKEGDEDWEKISIPSTTAEKELKAAPIPVVNFWQQRREAAQAKLKEQVTQRTPAPTSTQAKSRPQTTASDEARRKSSNHEGASVAESGRNNSNARIARDQGNNVSPRSTSQQDEKSSSHPPPVDAESWPTPESAITELGRRSSVVEKGERGEVIDANASNRKNKWQTLPFVPSVKFETQLPAARRGGRPATTPRGRGAANGQGEKSAEKSEPGSMGPPPLPKTVSEQDRGRKNNAARSVRGSSVPTKGGDNNSQQPKPATSTAKGAEAPAVEMLPVTARDGTINANTPLTQAPSRSPSRHVPQNASTNKTTNPDFEPSSVQGTETLESPSGQFQQRERAARVNSDPFHVNEQGEKPPGRDWTKDRTSNTQKSENWRSERRGERSERGRGTYRGRGNHSGYNTNPSFTAPLPQTGFDTLKQGGQFEPRSRQSSQPFGTPASFGGSRNSNRSQSIPVTMLSNGYYQPAPGFAQPLSPIQTDTAFTNFGQMPNGMSGGIMSAMPYNEQLNGFALFSMVVSQL